MPEACLLPPNASRLERRAATAAAGIERVPIPLRDLWNPWTCPAALLPYLAWARSVDRWDPAWPLATRRAVTASSFYVHRRKGTIGALRRVVEPLGLLFSVVEWWQENPPGPRATFRLDVGVLDGGISDTTHEELERLIDDARPLSRHLIGLTISMRTQGNAYVAGALHDGGEMTVYPYAPVDLDVSGRTCAAGAAHIADTLTIHP